MRQKLIVISTLLLLCLTLNAQGIREMRAREIEPPTVRELFLSNPEDGGLVIYSTIPNLFFDSNMNSIVKKEENPREGKYRLFLKTMPNQIIIIKSKGYAECHIHIKNLKAQEGRYYALEDISEDVGIGDSQAVVFNVKPADAIITAGGKTFKSGEAQPLKLGKHQVKINKEGYKNIQEIIEVSETSILFNYELEQIDVVLVKFRSQPDGADLYIDNVNKGKTNRDLFLYPGTYSVKLMKDGYISIDGIMEVPDKGPNEFNYSLIKNIASLKINTIQAYAKVYLNNKEVNKNEQIDLTPGTYDLEVRADLFETYRERIDLKAGDNEQRNINLKANYGQIKVVATPSNAQVFINNEEIDSSKLLRLSPGIYQLLIKADSHIDYSEMVEIKLDETLQKSISLSPKYGELMILVNPSDANIQITQNDKIIKSFTGSQIVKDLFEGNYEITAKMSGYKSYKGNINIIDKQRAELNIEMKEGSDTPKVISKNMVFVEGGAFQMGSNEYSREKPIHSVTVSSFFIGKYELTQKEWQEVMGNNPSYFKGDNRPVEKVTWYDAVEFCNKLSEKEGLTPAYTINGDNVSCNWSANGYRLPTEAEWEYAARGGNKSRNYRYSGSNTVGDVAWYSSNSRSQTHDVGTKAANELGIYDMSGNVWEWSWDWYDDSYYSSSPSSNPRGPNSGSYRVLRGGSFHNDDYCRVAHRGYNSPGYSYSNLGFRLVRTFE